MFFFIVNKAGDGTNFIYTWIWNCIYCEILIDERDYDVSAPTKDSAFKSLANTFKNIFLNNLESVFHD